MKFRDWRVKKLVEECQHLLEQESDPKKGDVPTLSEQEKKSLQDKLRTAAESLDFKKKSLERKWDNLEELKDKVYSKMGDLEDEMDRSPELKTKYADLYDELEQQFYQHLADQEDIENELNYIEDGDAWKEIEKNVKAKHAEGESAEREEDPAKKEDPGEEEERRKQVSQTTKEMEEVKDRIKRLTDSVKEYERIISDRHTTDSQRSRHQVTLDHEKEQLKKAQQELADLEKKHKEATGR